VGAPHYEVCAVRGRIVEIGVVVLEYVRGEMYRNLADSLMMTFMWPNLRYECDMFIVPPLCKAMDQNRRGDMKHWRLEVGEGVMSGSRITGNN